MIGRLDRIRAEVDRISEKNLDARVAGDGVDDEVGRLAATMNAMLERLDVAARRQRDFVADVSHDLQSPLAAQRVALEVALAGPEAVDTVRLRDEVLGATADMERLVGDLLVIASVDASTGPAAVLMDLDSVVLEEATRARVGGAVEVDTSAVSAAPAYADIGDVRRVVRNLLDNALAHAGSRVELFVDVTDDGLRPWAELLVVDDGPGVPAEHRDRSVASRRQRSRAVDRPLRRPGRACSDTGWCNDSSRQSCSGTDEVRAPAAATAWDASPAPSGWLQRESGRITIGSTPREEVPMTEESTRDLALKCSDLHVRYGMFTAVDGLSLFARSGEILGLLGP